MTISLKNPKKKINVAFDRYAMLIDGKREVIRSGAMHYFRLPSQALWRDRLFKLKAAGYNTVDLYFCWNYHSPAPGVYDFTGIRDVEKLLEITQELGLYVIARPGPYINAEYSGGGFPGWLLARKNLNLRNRATDGRFVWDEMYMECVREWWEQIVPLIAASPNVLMMQIENEYATQDVEPDYMQALYDLSRELGVTVPLMHNDLYAAGLYQEIVDLYAFDNYSVTAFDNDWRENSGIFAVLDNIEGSLRPFCENRPLIVAELQAGWYAGWKGHTYHEIIRGLGREHIAVSTKTLLAQGLTVFNHYKAVGGTNWDYTGSIDTYTSYDFAAPISEAGLNTDRLYEAKAINYFLSSFDLAATEKVEASETGLEVSDETCLFSVRALKENPTARWMFLRNLSQSPKDITITGSVAGKPSVKNLPVTLNPVEMLMLPVNLPLAGGAKLCQASLEPLWQTSRVLVLKGDRAGQVVLELARQTPDKSALAPRVIAGQVGVSESGGQVRLDVGTLKPGDIAAVQLEGLSVYFLGRHLSDTLWVQEDGFMVAGAEARLSETTYGVSSQVSRLILIGPHGALEKEAELDHTPPPELPVLKNWTVTSASGQLHRAEGFGPVSETGCDFDANGHFEGSGWYRYPLKAASESAGTGPITISFIARHLWAAYLNGALVGEGHQPLALMENELPPPAELVILPEQLPTGADNELVIFVDGLGHPRGFSDDPRTPQGLLTFEVTGEEGLREEGPKETRQKTDARGGLRFSPGIATEAVSTKTANAAIFPLVHLATEFTLSALAGRGEKTSNPKASPGETPLGVNLGGLLSELDYERVNIYLNGNLIGRHWRSCQRQVLYYLPLGMLKSGRGESNRLELICMNFDRPGPLPEAAAFEGLVTLEAYTQLTPVQL